MSSRQTSELGKVSGLLVSAPVVAGLLLVVICHSSGIDQTRSFNSAPVNVRSCLKPPMGMVEADDRQRAQFRLFRTAYAMQSRCFFTCSASVRRDLT